MYLVTNSNEIPSLLAKKNCTLPTSDFFFRNNALTSNVERGGGIAVLTAAFVYFPTEGL
jgi:hypothetical protein